MGIHIGDEERIKGLEMQNRDIYEKETDYACKADILRYEILYQYGGVYIDADIVLLKMNFIYSLNKIRITYSLQ